jgi:hypothetical protein
MGLRMDMPGLLELIEGRLGTPRPDCLIWPAAVDRGYGRLHVDGKSRRVHRVVWELKHGPIPDGLTIDHLCRIRSCCNTEHMELVTALENYERAKPFRAKAMGLASRGDECKNGHPYSPETTKIRSNGHRRCLTCDAANREQRNARRNERRRTEGRSDRPRASDAVA